MIVNLTLSEALLRYRTQVSILKKGYLQESYRIDQLCRSRLAQKQLRTISSPDIATYRDERLSLVNARTGKPISPATVRLEMSLLSSLFDVARIEWGATESNPVQNVRKPAAPPGRDRRLLPREERKILRHCHSYPNPELYSIVVLALETAMRQGEILKLTWEHINFKSGVAHLPETKNGTKRDVPLSQKAREALVRLGAKKKGQVFSYTSNGLKSSWRYMLIKLDIEDLHFHDLRHEACSKLFELGTLDIMEVAAISGHKSLSMLKRYTHLRAARLVKKLEGNRSRGHQLIANHLVPYPATVVTGATSVEVRVLDFDNVVGRGACFETAQQHAQDALLRQLMLSIRNKIPIPAPDQYLENVDDLDVILLDPLGTQEATPALTL
jgi:integrase